MTSNLTLSVGSDLTRTLGCADLSGIRAFYVLLGSTTNNIQCELNQPVVQHTTEKLSCKRGSANILRLDRSDVDPRIDVQFM
jgi:hypothetical protein